MGTWKVVVYALFVYFRYVWESKADGAFAISEDTWNEPLGRGTEIRLHLREEAGEYLEESKLKVSAFNIWWIMLCFTVLCYFLHLFMVSEEKANLSEL